MTALGRIAVASTLALLGSCASTGESLPRGAVHMHDVQLVTHEFPRSTTLHPQQDERGDWWLVSPPVHTGPFNELLPSWNIEVPEGEGFVIELRVATWPEGDWSPWLLVGSWGAAPSRPSVVEFDHGRIDVDLFRSDRAFGAAQYRVAMSGDVHDWEPRIERVGLCFSDRRDVPYRALTWAIREEPPRTDWLRRLDVPFRSQRVEDASIQGRICSPTSVSMVLAYHGVEVPTATVAATAYDASHDIYGNWPNNVQAAFVHGLPGYITRFNDWADVRRRIADGQPLVISISAKAGELEGAPYASTGGHLLVLTGFADADHVHVNDPAAANAEEGMLVYSCEDLETVWMGKGGTAYVILGPDEDPLR